MLLLGICPQCGWKTFHIYGDDGQWQVTCPEHGLVNTRTYDQLLGQLDIGFGVDAGLDDS